MSFNINKLRQMAKEAEQQVIISETLEMRYDRANKNGYKGTFGEWKEILKQSKK